MVKKDPGHVFVRPPMEYRAALTLEGPLGDEQCRRNLVALFDHFVMPMANEALSPAGILRLRERGIVHLTPSVEIGVRAAI